MDSDLDLRHRNMISFPTKSLSGTCEGAAHASNMMSNMMSFPTNSLLACPALIEWTKEALLRYIPDGSVEITSFNDSLVHVLSADGHFLSCSHGLFYIYIIYRYDTRTDSLSLSLSLSLSETNSI